MDFFSNRVIVIKILELPQVELCCQLIFATWSKNVDPVILVPGFQLSVVQNVVWTQYSCVTFAQTSEKMEMRKSREKVYKLEQNTRSKNTDKDETV